MADKDKKEKKKKKKEAVSVKLPNARKSIKRQRQMAQGKADYNDMWHLIGVFAIFILIAFILLGGINQKATLITFKNISQTIGEKVSSWIHPENVIITENGVYVDTDGDGEAG